MLQRYVLRKTSKGSDRSMATYHVGRLLPRVRLGLDLSVAYSTWFSSTFRAFPLSLLNSISLDDTRRLDAASSTSAAIHSSIDPDRTISSWVHPSRTFPTPRLSGPRFYLPYVLPQILPNALVRLRITVATSIPRAVGSSRRER